jgi:hypothetical protein
MPAGASGAGQGGRGRTPRAVRVARWVLYGVLVCSAALTLFGLPELQRAVSEGRWPPATLAIGPGLLLAFLVGFVAYRLVLVRAGRYPAGKALVRIALTAAVVGAVAGILRLPAGPADPGQSPVDLSRALLSSHPEVRAMAAELVRHRPAEQALACADRLVDLLGDRSPEVRRQARLSLAALAGEDVGGDGPDAASRWRAHLRALRSGAPRAPPR